MCFQGLESNVIFLEQGSNLQLNFNPWEHSLIAFHPQPSTWPSSTPFSHHHVPALLSHHVLLLTCVSCHLYGSVSMSSPPYNGSPCWEQGRELGSLSESPGLYIPGHLVTPVYHLPPGTQSPEQCCWRMLGNSWVLSSSWYPETNSGSASPLGSPSPLSYQLLHPNRNVIFSS